MFGLDIGEAFDLMGFLAGIKAFTTAVVGGSAAFRERRRAGS